MKRSALGRRRFLRGASSVVVGLPALEVFRPAKAGAQGGDKPRLLVYYLPNGRRPEWWVPSAAMKFPAESSALDPFGSQALALVNLSNNAALRSPGAAHAMGTGTVATGRAIGSLSGGRLENGVSIDQLLVQQLKPQSRFSSIQWSAGEPGPCDVGGSSCSYTQSISWTGEAKPLIPTIQPQVAFNRLFGSGVDGLSGREADVRRGSLKSVLDFVRDDARVLQSKLGSSDKERLEAYFTSVREVERNLQGTQGTCTQAEGFAVSSLSYPDRVSAFHQLIKLAFECEQTRVISFMIEFGLSGRSHDFISAAGGHHKLSHYGNTAEYERLRLIEQWEARQLASLLDMLANASGSEGASLLDETIVLALPSMGQGSSHDHARNCPILFGGKGTIQSTGKRLAFDPASSPSLNRLHVSLLDAYGVEGAFGKDGARFGDDGNAALDGIVA